MSIVILHALDDLTLPYAGGPIGAVPGRGPEVLPVEEAAAAWASCNSCTPPPASMALPDGDVVLRWPGCTAPVTLWRTLDGGHAWADIATDLILEMVLDPGSEPAG